MPLGAWFKTSNGRKTGTDTLESTAAVPGWLEPGATGVQTSMEGSERSCASISSLRNRRWRGSDGGDLPGSGPAGDGLRVDSEELGHFGWGQEIVAFSDGHVVSDLSCGRVRERLAGAKLPSPSPRQMNSSRATTMSATTKGPSTRRGGFGLDVDRRDGDESASSS